MSITPIHTIANVTSVSPIAAPAKSGTEGFGSIMKGLVQDANQQQMLAGNSIEQFATGQTDNIQDVAVAMAKADISFRLVMEVRNQLMESYQEIMRMQV